MAESKVYDFQVKTIDGRDTTLAPYQGKVLLIVNTASKCGLTPQYEGLEKLYKKYHSKGLEILGFPCNQFGAQEPGTEEEIKSFCDLNYQISFPMFSKIDVNGDSTHPLYVYLKKERKGFLGSGVIKWNFTKFLIDRQGEVIQRFAPTTVPEDIAAEIEKLL